jgi:hypothetical protein
MPTFETAALVTGMLAALAFRTIADRHRSEEGNSVRPAPFYWRPRAHFTDQGWRYRTISFVCGWAAVMPLCVDWLYTSMS